MICVNNKAIVIGIVFCLASLAWLLVECAITVRSSRNVAEELVAIADYHATEIERKADERIGDVLNVLDSRLASIEERSETLVAQALQKAEKQVARGLGSAEARLGEAIAEVRQLRLETQAAVAEARGLIADVRQTHATAAARLDYWTDCEQNGLCWQGAATDVLLAVRRAALSVDQAMPRIVAAAEGSAAGMQATAQASAQTAENLARITQPGPRWLRWAGIGLGIAAPAAQTALPFVVRKAELR